MLIVCNKKKDDNLKKKPKIDNKIT